MIVVQMEACPWITRKLTTKPLFVSCSLSLNSVTNDRPPPPPCYITLPTKKCVCVWWMVAGSRCMHEMSVSERLRSTSSDSVWSWGSRGACNTMSRISKQRINPTRYSRPCNTHTHTHTQTHVISILHWNARGAAARRNLLDEQQEAPARGTLRTASVWSL